MKVLLILLLLLSGCTIKEDPVEEVIEVEEETQEVTPGQYNDMVFLKSGIELVDHDMVLQDYYSNSLALYKGDALVALYDPHGENILPQEAICSTNMRQFFIRNIDPLDPGQLTVTCDGQRSFYAYGNQMKSIYKVGTGEPDYSWGLTNTLRMLYILESSTIVKEVDIASYLNKGPNDPIKITEYTRQPNNGVIPVYELKSEPSLVDGVMTFDLTGKVGFVTDESLRPDILGTLKFDGVGADTSAKDGLVTVIIDGKIGLADKEGNLVVEAKYEPLRDLAHQIFSDNFHVLQKGPQASVLPLNNFIMDYQTKTHFISDSSQVNGLRAVKKNGKVGFLDESGQELDTFYFDDAFVTHHNRVWVKQGRSWSIIEVGKDIGYQEKALQEAFAQEVVTNNELALKFEKGEYCNDGQTLYEVTSDIGLYVRDGDHEDSGTLGVLNYKQRVCGIEKGVWIEFEYQGVPGYLFKEYTQPVVGE